MSLENNANFKMDINAIMGCLPHRYPFLLVDRVVELEPQKRIVAYKNITFNEPFFQGHFPNYPVMPGVLILEALAQAGGIMVLADSTPEELSNKIFLFAGMENVKFRKQVVPGDRLELRAIYIKHKMRIWRMKAEAYVDGQLAAEAEITAAVTPKGGA